MCASDNECCNYKMKEDLYRVTLNTLSDRFFNENNNATHIFNDLNHKLKTIALESIKNSWIELDEFFNRLYKQQYTMNRSIFEKLFDSIKNLMINSEKMSHTQIDPIVDTFFSELHTGVINIYERSVGNIVNPQTVHCLVERLHEDSSTLSLGKKLSKNMKETYRNFKLVLESNQEITSLLANLQSLDYLNENCILPVIELTHCNEICSMKNKLPCSDSCNKALSNCFGSELATTFNEFSDKIEQFLSIKDRLMNPSKVNENLKFELAEVIKSIEEVYGKSRENLTKRCSTNIPSLWRTRRAQYASPTAWEVSSQSSQQTHGLDKRPSSSHELGRLLAQFKHEITSLKSSFSEMPERLCREISTSSDTKTCVHLSPMTGTFNHLGLNGKKLYQGLSQKTMSLDRYLRQAQNEPNSYANILEASSSMFDSQRQKVLQPRSYQLQNQRPWQSQSPQAFPSQQQQQPFSSNNNAPFLPKDNMPAFPTGPVGQVNNNNPNFGFPQRNPTQNNQPNNMANMNSFYDDPSYEYDNYYDDPINTGNNTGNFGFPPSQGGGLMPQPQQTLGRGGNEPNTNGFPFNPPGASQSPNHFNNIYNNNPFGMPGNQGQQVPPKVAQPPIPPSFQQPSSPSNIPPSGFPGPNTNVVPQPIPSNPSAMGQFPNNNDLYDDYKYDYGGYDYSSGGFNDWSKQPSPVGQPQQTHINNNNNVSPQPTPPTNFPLFPNVPDVVTSSTSTPSSSSSSSTTTTTTERPNHVSSTTKSPPPRRSQNPDDDNDVSFKVPPPVMKSSTTTTTTMKPTTTTTTTTTSSTTTPPPPTETTTREPPVSSTTTTTSTTSTTTTTEKPTTTSTSTTTSMPSTTTTTSTTTTSTTTMRPLLVPPKIIKPNKIPVDKPFVEVQEMVIPKAISPSTITTTTTTPPPPLPSTPRNQHSFGINNNNNQLPPTSFPTDPRQQPKFYEPQMPPPSGPRQNQRYKPQQPGSNYSLGGNFNYNDYYDNYDDYYNYMDPRNGDRSSVPSMPQKPEVPFTSGNVNQFGQITPGGGGPTQQLGFPQAPLSPIAPPQQQPGPPPEQFNQFKPNGPQIFGGNSGPVNSFLPSPPPSASSSLPAGGLNNNQNNYDDYDEQYYDYDYDCDPNVDPNCDLYYNPGESLNEGGQSFNPSRPQSPQDFSNGNLINWPHANPNMELTITKAPSVTINHQHLPDPPPEIWIPENYEFDELQKGPFARRNHGQTIVYVHNQLIAFLLFVIYLIR